MSKHEADNKMNYDYTLINYSIADFDWGDFEERVLLSLEKTFCNDTSFEYFREENVPMKWNYYDKNNKLLGSIELNTNDCV